MSHPLVIALFGDARTAADGARAARALGVARRHLSIVARDHQAEGEIAEEVGGTPGAEMEDSRPAARLAELGAHILAAIAIVMPGIGPIVAAGPLAAGLGEAAGHVAGGVAGVLARSGVPAGQADEWQRRVQQGAVLLGVHVFAGNSSAIAAALEQHGAERVIEASWDVDSDER